MENKNIELTGDVLTVELMERMGLSKELAELCGRTVAAQENGDTCLGPLDDQICGELAASSVVTQSPKTDIRPFVLENKYLYTRRNWLYKQTILNRILVMAKKDLGAITVPTDGIFAKMEERQRQGVETMCRYQFSILTGGPGTGKTYTIARAVKLIQDTYGELRLGLAAPTGKAAARVKEAMDKEAQAIELAQSLSASTLHSLLKPIYDQVTFKHNHSNPLPLDWLIVDEASMIDMPLMAKLLDALSPTARLTLVGDANQLASVEPGRVFGDLCKMSDILKCELNVSRRFPQGGTIDKLACAVNAGKSEDAMGILQQPNTCVHYTQLPGSPSAARWAGFEALVKEKFASFASQTTPEGALDHLNDCRILCAMRKGPYGIGQMNEFIQKLLGNKCPLPIMILKNDRSLDVNNGDVGVVMNNGDEQKRLYLRKSDGSMRSIPLALLPETELAFASTVHKSQGSEYTDVVIVLPPDPQMHAEDALNPILTRELLYTAITRTKGHVYIYSGNSTLECCCKNAIVRNTGMPLA